MFGNCGLAVLQVAGVPSDSDGAADGGHNLRKVTRIDPNVLEMKI